MSEPLRCGKAGRPAALRALLLVLVFSLPIALAVRPVTDPDIWSHLRHGQWIVEHRAVPLVDAFSLRAAGKRWIAYSWLFEVLVYGLYESLGLPGLVFYTAGLALVVAWALLGLMDRVQPDPAISCILCAAGILAMAPLLVHPRPWLLTVALSESPSMTHLLSGPSSPARTQVPCIFFKSPLTFTSSARRTEAAPATTARAATHRVACLIVSPRVIDRMMIQIQKPSALTVKPIEPGDEN